VARSGNHSIRRWGRRIYSRGRGAQGSLHLPEGPINAPRGAGSRRRRQRRRQVQSASTRGIPKGQGAGGPRGNAVRLALPRRADAEGAAGAGRPLGWDIRFIPTARGRPRCFAPELDPAAAELEGSMSLGAWKQKWHWRKEVKCRRSRGRSI
jgi:hypothetical protein